MGRSTTEPWSDAPDDTDRRATCIDANGQWVVALEETLRLKSCTSRLPAASLPLGCGQLQQCALSPDGTWLAATTDAGALGFWRLQPRAAEWTAPDADVMCLEFSPDADHLAAAISQEIRLYDTVSGRAREPIAVDGVVGRLAWSPNGSRLAYCQVDGRARVVDLEGRRKPMDIGREERFTCVVFQSDDQLLCGDDAGRLLLWDLSTRRFRELAHYDAAISDVASCASVGVTLAAVGTAVHALRAAGDALVLSGHGEAVEKLAISRSGDSLLTRSISGQVRRWRVNWVSGETQNAPLPVPTTGHDTAEISPDGQTFVTLDHDRALFWDAKTGEFRGGVTAAAPLRSARFCPQPLEGTTRLAVCDEQGRLQMWVGDEVPRQPTVYLGGVVRSIASLPGTSQVICGGDFPELSLLDANPSLSRQWPLRDRPALHVSAAVATSPDALLAVASWPGNIEIYRLRAATGELAWQQTLGPGTPLIDLQLSRDAQRLVALTRDARLMSWRRDEVSALYVADAASPAADIQGATCMLLSPDGNTCILGTDQGQWQRWTGDDRHDAWRLAADRPAAPWRRARSCSGYRTSS